MKVVHSSSSVLLHERPKVPGVVANMTTAQSPLQRYKDIHALLTFKEPQDVEANELKWQSFLKVRHESYPASSPQTKEITPEPDSSPSPKFLALLELPVKDTNSEDTIELRLQKVLASDCSQATLQAQFCKELDILVSTGKNLEDKCPKEEYQYLRFIEDMLSLSAFYLSFTHLETNGSEFAGRRTSTIFLFSPYVSCH
ncbi:hypothetical protein ACMFMG_002192 [Clarireedia jacksonii]